MRRLLFLVVMIIILAAGGYAQDKTWVVDKAHSHVGFSIAHLMIYDVQGDFTDYDVQFTSNADDFSDASVQVEIRTASIDTDNEKRDNHLRSSDFFKIEKHPSITFRSKSFSKMSGDKLKITGDLTMKGVTKEIVLDAVYRGQTKDPWGNTRTGFKAATVLDRYDYDLKHNTALETGGFLIGQEVDIMIDMQFILK